MNYPSLARRDPSRCAEYVFSNFSSVRFPHDVRNVCSQLSLVTIHHDVRHLFSNVCQFVADPSRCSQCIVLPFVTVSRSHRDRLGVFSVFHVQVGLLARAAVVPATTQRSGSGVPSARPPHWEQRLLQPHLDQQVYHTLCFKLTCERCKSEWRYAQRERRASD